MKICKSVALLLMLTCVVSAQDFAATVSWRDYTDTRLIALEKATCLAATTMERRLEGMNEFRAQLRDQNGTFMTRNEYALAHEKLASDVNELKQYRSSLEGKASQTSMMLTAALAVMGVLLSAVGLIVGWIRKQ